MLNTIRTWLQMRYRMITGSIAFYPAVIAILFAAFAMTLIWFDLSGPGLGLKEKMGWMSLKDAEAARSIVSTVAAGIITLTVFSFSMVMIVINQAASQLTNRVLDQLIGNRFQQVVLGIYIGTIVFALLLLTTIRKGDTGSSVPALSTYSLILIVVVDIFLFIYFLHYITRSVKYEVIIQRIHRETLGSMEKALDGEQPSVHEVSAPLPFVVASTGSGVYTEVDRRSILSLCVEHDLQVEVVELPGSFVLKGSPLIRIDRPVPEELATKFLRSVPLATMESVDGNYAFGFRQLTEVAMKALSPGINDPGTAMLAIRSLFNLFAYRLEHHPQERLQDEQGRLRITIRQWTFEQLFKATVLAVWDYGKGDRSIQHELANLLPQLRTGSAEVKEMILRVERAIEKELIDRKQEIHRLE
ncbi:MAG: DUF2254 domain-containing protein [Flavobacteriales bacterium]|nr:DUF2254 domain-containing protein [Flavobacteriales bacterium]